MNYHFGDNVGQDKITQYGPGSIGKVETGSREELSAVAEALRQLRQQAKPDAASADEVISYGALAEAEKAAAAGDGRATEKALKKAGTWALNQATVIGVPVAVEVLKRSLGLG